MMDYQQTFSDDPKYKRISARDFLEIIREVKLDQISEEYADNVSYDFIVDDQLISNLIIYDDFYILSIEDEHHSERPSWNAERMRFGVVLVISNCIFEKSFNINYGLFTNFIHFSNCHFYYGIRISNSIFQSSLMFTNTFCSSFVIESGEFYDVALSFSTSVNELSILGGEFKDFNIGLSRLEPEENYADLVIESIKIDSDEKFGNFIISDVKANDIQVSNRLNKDSSLLFKDIKTNSFSLKDLIIDGNIILNNVSSNQFAISNLQNNGILKIYELSPLAENNIKTFFDLKKSNLGKAQLFRINFQIFNQVYISDSYLIDTIFANIRWKDEITAFDIEEDENKNFDQNENKQLNLSQRRESYRQLKLAMDRQGDKIQEHKFYSKEMNIYNEMIPSTWKFWEESFWTYWILKFSHYFSDYGQSFRRPFIGILVITLILHLLFLTINSFYPDLIYYKPHPVYLSLNLEYELNAFYISLGEYFALLNPVHKFNENLKGLGVLLDLFSRIASSYFVYNLIRATRRFVK